MLMEYSERRSKLDNIKFKEIVEQLKPDKKMATAFKSIFDVAEEKAMEKGKEIGKEIGMEKGIAIGEAKANPKVQESKRQAIIKLMKTTHLENFQIAEVFDVSITFVEAIRLELNA